MNILAPVTLVVCVGVVIALSVCVPSILGDNSFLLGFINHEILNILAVIMTITITSVATIHIWFNELEKKHEKKVFGEARDDINQSAVILVWLFVVEVALLIVRSWFDGSASARSVFNGLSLVILLADVLVLIDIIGVIRKLTKEG